MLRVREQGVTYVEGLGAAQMVEDLNEGRCHGIFGPYINNAFIERGGHYCGGQYSYKIVDRFPGVTQSVAQLVNVWGLTCPVMVDGPQFTAAGLKRHEDSRNTMPANTMDVLNHWIVKLVDDGSIHQLLMDQVDKGEKLRRQGAGRRCSEWGLGG
jgi:hypothetical protein